MSEKLLVEQVITGDDGAFTRLISPTKLPAENHLQFFEKYAGYRRSLSGNYPEDLSGNSLIQWSKH